MHTDRSASLPDGWSAGQCPNGEPTPATEPKSTASKRTAADRERPARPRDDRQRTRAIAAYRRGIEQARVAKFAESLLLKDAARAAADVGMSVREFANAAGLSKSRAGRELRASRWPSAIRPENVAAVNAALDAAGRDDAAVLPLRTPANHDP